MAYKYNTNDHLYWFDTTAQIAADASICTEFKTAKAASLTAPETIYIANGTSWISMTDHSTLAYFTLTLTVGANTTVTVVDAEDNAYVNGSRVQSGATLTITAAADDGFTLSTFTVGGVDKTASNPDTHTMSADLTVVTEATEAG
jgi:hypothetical protein